MHRIVKVFGGVTALDRASLEVAAGTVHGLVGQNGAGKSTLIKVLAGIHRPDAGTIEIGGRRQNHMTPQAAERLGIHFIHQERLLVRSFTVGEALFLGREPRHRGLPVLARARMERDARALLGEQFGIDVPRGALIRDLSTAQQQIVQIVRALLAEPRLLVLDEPTAALVRREVDRLFDILRRLRGQGLTIVYISHYLQEIEAICDRVTVIRNGVDVATLDAKRTSAREIASLMVARDIAEIYSKRKVTLGEPILEVQRLARRPAFADVSFSLRKGEILGLTGLVGSGAKELTRCLFGLDRPDSGTIRIQGEAAPLNGPHRAVARDLALVPEDRRGHGVALDLSVARNITLASLDRFSRLGFLRRQPERAEVDRLIEALSVRTSGPDAAVRELSGGNQQKVVLAKWLSRRSNLYLLDEPTVGVDVGAKQEIYRLIGDLVGRGAGVFLLSADLMELLGLCDRVLVMYRGRISAELRPGDTTSDALLAAVTGAGKAA